MRAVRAHERGGPEQVAYESTPRPEPAPGEVLVAVRAASITSGELDWDAREAYLRGPGRSSSTPWYAPAGRPSRAAPPDSPQVSVRWRRQPVAGTTVPKEAAAICWT